MNPWLILFNLLVIAFTACAMVSDVRYWKLPNWLALTGLAGALVFHATVGWIGGGAAGVLEHLKYAFLGFLLSFGVLFLAWLIGSGSAGDAKFMGAVGAWLGPAPIAMVLVLSAVIELFRVAAVYLFRSGKRGFRNAMEDMKHEGEKQKSGKARQVWGMKVPYGVSAAIATWIVMLVLSILSTSQSKFWQPSGGTKTSQLAEIKQVNS
jgi:prepilin peptidase CpaA